MTTFAYGFHLLPASLQKASFYSVKGILSKDKKPSFAGREDTVENRNRRRASQHKSANGQKDGSGDGILSQSSGFNNFNHRCKL